MSVAALEQQKSNAKELIERRNLALKLSRNPDFKKLILKEWMVEEAARMVQVSGDPSLTPVDQANAMAMAQATGHLKRWLSVQCRMGDQAEAQMEELDEALAEARAEEAEVDAEDGDEDETRGNLA